MLNYLDGGIVLAIMAGIFTLGMLDKLLVRSLYKRLIKQSDSMATTKNKFLKQLKQKFENTYRINDSINNIPIFLEKQVNQFKFLGFTLRGIDNFTGQAAWVAVVLGLAGSFTAYWYNLRFELIILHISAGILFGILGFLLNNIIDNVGNREVLLVQLGDYLENTLLCHLQREEKGKEEITVQEKEKVPSNEQSLRDIEYLKKSLSQIAAGMEPMAQRETSRQLSVEDEKIIKDIIKEYLV